MNISLSSDWINVIINETHKNYWNGLEKMVDEAYKNSLICPKKEDIFKCFNFFNFKQTKVVIIGQDPYHTKCVANGLAFSVNKNQKLPPSLKNIFIELENDLKIKRVNGDLSDWAKQGVLLLNNTLTVEEKKPNSHVFFGWSMFTNNILNFINKNLDHVIFVFWGNFAKTKIKYIDQKKHFAIQSSHPSPFSWKNNKNSFFGSNVFSMINKKLIEWNKKPIEW